MPDRLLFGPGPVRPLREFVVGVYEVSRRLHLRACAILDCQGTRVRP